MFHNFGKVFAFTFHNQAGSKSYKILTIVVALLLLILPPLIMTGIAGDSDEEEQELESCGADKIYVVSDLEPEVAYYTLLQQTVEENYKKIRYVSCESVDAAMEEAKEGEASLVLYFYPEDDYIRGDILLPEGSTVTEEEASNYLTYMSRNAGIFSMLLTGLPDSKLMGLMPGNTTLTYTESGFAKGVSLDEEKEGVEELMSGEIREVFAIVLPYLTIMIMYFMILGYGNSIAQSMVMEKESKLMDTMLISLHPEALVFGKLLATIAAGLLQIFIWLICGIIGFAVGMKLPTVLYPDYQSPLSVFFGFMEDMNLFRPGNVVLALAFLVFGFVLYSSIAAIAGAISSNREEVGSQSMIFVMPLLFSFMCLMMGGGLEQGGAPIWMRYVPFTAALIMPSNLSLGMEPPFRALISFALLIVCTLLIVIAAGRIYKMMALYKGNKVRLTEVLKRLLAKNP